MTPQTKQALKMAIETIKSCKHLEDTDKVILSLGDYKKLVDAFKEALQSEASEQEPVAWMNSSNNAVISKYRKKQPSIGNNYPNFDQPLYTHPTEFKTLTDEEISEISAENTHATKLEFARSIEQALREKNTS